MTIALVITCFLFQAASWRLGVTSDRWTKISVLIGGLAYLIGHCGWYFFVARPEWKAEVFLASFLAFLVHLKPIASTLMKDTADGF